MSGQIIDKFGIVFDSEDVSLAHFEKKKGDKINSHNHKNMEVFFTIVKGEIKIYLDDKDEFIVKPGKVLNFKGERYISADILEDSEVFVYLVKRRS